MLKLNLSENYLPDRACIEKRCAPGERFDAFFLDGPGCIRHFWISPGLKQEGGRNILLRIYFDGEETPSVFAPLSDFFGVMHGAQWYPVNTPYISVQEKVGYNCYFPMPFAKSARIELEIGEEPAFLCSMVDWHRYTEPLAEPLRFRARWRHENPAESYGGEYLMLDASGRGELLGFFYGVRLLDDEDRWSHGGSENIYLDGEELPAYIRGVGGEDSFGTAFGGAIHSPETRLWCGMPYYVHEDVGQARPAQRVVGYRFYGEDSIPFRKSVHMRFGCMKNDICSTVYWYSDGGVREFFRMPPVAELRTGTRCGREEHALPLPVSGEWRVFGPVPAAEGIDPIAFLKKLPREGESLPLHTGGVYGADARTGAVWLPAKSVHHFLDFRWYFRIHKRGVSPTEEGFAVASAELFAEKEVRATVRMTYDDGAYLSVGGKITALPAHRAFRTEEVTVTLKKGRNKIAVALTNTVGSNHGGWCFAFTVRDEDGKEHLPSPSCPEEETKEERNA